MTANSTRPYPLDDNATGVDDGGQVMPSDIVVDLSLRWPATAGRYAFIGGITISDTLVSIVILAADSLEAATQFTPLAAFSAKKPVLSLRPQLLQPLYPGAGGFIAFDDVSENTALRFSSPSQSLLSPAAAIASAALPVSSIGKSGTVAKLSGIVRLQTEGDIELVRKTVRIDGRDVPAVVLQLTAINGAEVLSKYVGPCGVRPESNTCRLPGIETVNGVAPDCDGNLVIRFEGMTEGPYASCGGVTIDQALNLSDVCTRQTRPNRFQGQDLCASSSVSMSSASASSVSMSSVSLSSSSMASMSSESCAALPYVECFDTALSDSWATIAGSFSTGTGASPDEPAECTSDGLIQSADTSRRNILLWQDCGALPSIGKTVKTHVRLTSLASLQNAGLVLNYHTVDPFSNPHVEYFLLQINRNDNRVELLRYNGTAFSTENSVAPGLPFALADWYLLQADVEEDGPLVRITATIECASNPSWPSVTFSVLTHQWKESDGYHGLHAYRANTDFSFWSLENA